MTTVQASIGYQSGDLWAYVFKLLHLRWVITASGFKRAKPLRKLLTIGLGLLILAFCAGTYILISSLLRQLDSPLILGSGIDPVGLRDAMSAAILSGIFLIILLVSFRLLLQALYLAKDMDFLLTAPIPIRAVFVSKLLDAILPSFILVLVLGLPFLVSLGVTGGYRFVYYPLVLVVMALLALAAAGVSSLLVMAVVRIFPAKRVAEVLTLLGGILVIGLSQSVNFMGNSLESLSAEQISAGAGALSRLGSAWSPLAWGGRSLVDLGQGRWFSGMVFLALTAGLSAVVFWLALTMAERLYYTGWASLQMGTQRKRNHRRSDRRDISGQAGAGYLRGLLPSEVLAIVVKDLKLLRRDLNNLSQVIGGLIMGVVFAVMLLRGGGQSAAGRGDAPAVFMSLVQSAMAYGSMVIGLFVGWALLARLALVAFSMEGRSYWVLKTAPISAGKQLAAKFVMAYLPALILSWIYLLAIALLQRASLAILLYGLPSIALILAGLGGINLAFGVRSANLTWTDPRKMESGVTGLASTVASIVYQLVTLLLFFGPPIGFPLLGLSEGAGMVAGLLAGGTVALLCTFLPLALVRERVYRIGEE